MATIKQAINEAVERGKLVKLSYEYRLNICFISSDANSDEVKRFDKAN